MTIIWCMVPEIWSATDKIFCHFGPFFFSLLPPNNLKNQNFEKMEKNPGDITILHQCTKNPDHRLHCSWDTMHGRCNFYFSFWAIFCPFTPPNNLENQNFKKMKKNHGDIIIFQMCTTNTDHIIYDSWDMMPNRQTDRQRWVPHLKTQKNKWITRDNSIRYLSKK